MAYFPLPVNDENRLRVSTLPADIAIVTGSITAIQATVGTPVAGGTVIADVSRASNANIFCTGTFAGVNVTFEGSLEPTGENWFAIQAVRTNANTVETTTGALSAAPAYAWELSVNALSRIRVRATARTSGTQVWNMKLGSYATEPVPAIQTHAVTQSGSWYVGASASTAGTSVYYNSALTSTDVAVKTSSARLYAWDFYNPNDTDVYVQFWNALIANVTPGATAPFFSIRIPARSGRDYINTIPVTFSTALTVAATTTYNGSTAPTTAIESRVEYV